ncbi:MAG: hypothetical protein PHE55_02035, partial [Methylococcaceae bacterium]|nr:hypothetical protein [Methylococcaceae bacterium]
ERIRTLALGQLDRTGAGLVPGMACASSVTSRWTIFNGDRHGYSFSHYSVLLGALLVRGVSGKAPEMGFLGVSVVIRLIHAAIGAFVFAGIRSEKKPLDWYKERRMAFSLHSRYGFRRAAVVAMVLAIASGFIFGSASAVEKSPKQAKEAMEMSAKKQPADPLKEMRSQFDELTASLAGLKGRLDELGQNVRTNATSIEDLKGKLEKNAILLYERLSSEKEISQNLENLSARVAENEAKLAGKARIRQFGPVNPVPKSSPTNPSEAQPPADQSAGDTAQSDDAEKPATSIPASNGAFQTHDGTPAGLLLAALLVFIMPLGLTLLEASQLERWAIPQAGLRNLLVASVLVVAYFAVGYGVMFGETFLGVLDEDAKGSTFADLVASADLLATFGLYQLGLVVVSGLIVTTILSDRLSLPVYVFLALFFGALAYPTFGHWSGSGQWLPENAGWLEKLGFLDFAGATRINSFAAWFALGWVWMFPISRPLDSNDGHNGMSHQPNVSLVLLGVFVIWFGWFGLAIRHQEFENHRISLMALNVLLAGATALVVSLIYWVLAHRESGMGAVCARISAGAVGGLVAVSAALNIVMPLEAMVIGGAAALLQPLAYRILALRVIKQDQVAANLIAAYGFCGVWGTLCVGLFGTAGLFSKPNLGQTWIQTAGVSTSFVFGMATGLLSAIAYLGLSKFMNHEKIP